MLARWLVYKILYVSLLHRQVTNAAICGDAESGYYVDMDNAEIQESRAVNIHVCIFSVVLAQFSYGVCCFSGY